MPKIARPSAGKRHARPGKLYPLNMRTTAEIRERLARAAESSGRSLAQEVEHRLQRSFDQDDVLGGTRAAAVFRFLAALAQMIGDDWAEEREKFNQVLVSWTSHWPDLAPEQSPGVQDELVAALQATINEEPQNEYHLVAALYLVHQLDPAARESLEPKIKARLQAVEQGRRP